MQNQPKSHTCGQDIIWCLHDAKYSCQNGGAYQSTTWFLFYKMSNYYILGNNCMFFIFILIFPVTQTYPECLSIIQVTV